MYYIVIRKSTPEDTPAISEVVRKAYLSNVFGSWINALFHEIVFQLIVLSVALMFIFLSVPFIYCLLSVPLALIGLYVIIYGTLLMKASQLMYEKRPLECWVAEAYDPYFLNETPKDCSFKIIPEEKLHGEDVQMGRIHRKIIGTVGVMHHLCHDEMAWLFRLAVDERYRRRGVGLQLVQTAKTWCRNNKFNYVELAMSECQEGSRELFAKAGFDVKQLYHKKFLFNATTLQMFQLRCEVRPNF